jgi:hypothetical protein
MSALRCPHSFVLFLQACSTRTKSGFSNPLWRERRTGMSALRCPHSFVFFLRPARRERRAGFPTRFLEDKADRNVRAPLPALKTRIRNRFNKAGHVFKKNVRPRDRGQRPTATLSPSSSPHLSPTQPSTAERQTKPIFGTMMSAAPGCFGRSVRASPAIPLPPSG